MPSSRTVTSASKALAKKTGQKVMPKDTLAVKNKKKEEIKKAALALANEKEDEAKKGKAPAGAPPLPPPVEGTTRGR